MKFTQIRGTVQKKQLFEEFTIDVDQKYLAKKHLPSDFIKHGLLENGAQKSMIFLTKTVYS